MYICTKQLNHSIYGFFKFVVCLYDKFKLHMGYSFLYFANSFIAQCCEGSKPVELK